MVVVSGALAIQLLDDVPTAAHEARRLLDPSILTPSVVNVRLHDEPAHAPKLKGYM